MVAMIVVLEHTLGSEFGDQITMKLFEFLPIFAIKNCRLANPPCLSPG